MKLHLVVQNLETLDNGLPARTSLGAHGAVIGRSPTVNWCLPDPKNFISSRHCEVTFKDGAYIFTDISTNGTFINGRQVTQPHTLSNRDIIVIGHYNIVVEIEGANASSQDATTQGDGFGSGSGWAGWDHSASQPAPASHSDWDAPKSGSAMSGTGAMSQNWAAPIVTSTATEPNHDWAPTPQSAPAPSENPMSNSWGPASSPSASETPWGSAQDLPTPPPSSVGSSPWDSGPATPDTPASPWSSPITEKPASSQGSDIWGQISEGYVVDWARGGFGASASPPPLSSLATPAAATPSPSAATSWASPVEQSQGTAFTPTAQPTPAPTAPIVQTPAPNASQGLSGPSYIRFAGALGLEASALTLPEDETLALSATLLRRLVAGMVVMLEARARAKSQMGAQGTSLQFDGNNPMKFARTPEQALVQLLNPKARGFMEAERAIEDAFLDLQSHQMATLKAMQGALKATLERFSPNEIKKRVDSKGLMAKLFPDARDAALWKAYEKEFSGVVDGSDEAFMDVFSKEFRKAYDEQTAKKSF